MENKLNEERLKNLLINSIDVLRIYLGDIPYNNSLKKILIEEIGFTEEELDSLNLTDDWNQ